MTEPTIRILLDGHRRCFQPGESLAGEYSVDSYAAIEPKAVEASVLWYTEGQGDEDFSVHFFERWRPETGEPRDLRQPQRFETVLPNSPLSYDGLVVKVRWCVRIRVFLPRGKEIVEELAFQLGSLPPVQPLSES